MKQDSFEFQPGECMGGKYTIIQLLGRGWEGEVYLVREDSTGIERAVKFFFPNKNIKNKTLAFYAKKLHKLRHCPIIIQYHTQEVMAYKNEKVPFLVSEYVEGELLADFVKQLPGKRMHTFQALHFLHALVKGVEEIHRQKEYHGDLHAENIIVQRYGLGFELKIVDFFVWPNYSKSQNIQDDLFDMIRLFYDVLGGANWYHKQPDAVKSICCGLKKSLIKKKFRSSTKLRQFIENIEW